jgi:Tfp pilus assembly protein PilX
MMSTVRSIAQPRPIRTAPAVQSGCSPHRVVVRRRGITAMLAMLFMVLIGVLALGFYATVNTSMALASNDSKRSKALLAAESGIQFMRYHLAHVSVTHNTDPDQMMTDLYNDLSAQFNGTRNLGNNTIGFENNIITIPAETGQSIIVDPSDNSGFSVTISNVGGGASDVICKVVGQTGNGTYMSSKGVQLDFTRQQNNSDLFDSAVAAKGRLVMQKGTLGGVSGISPDTIASIMSAKGTSPAVTMTGGTIGGTLGVLDPSYAALSGGTIHGVSAGDLADLISNNYLQTVSAPDWPTFDTSVFQQYASNTYTGGNTLSNVTIPPNTNPKFTGNATINGIVYVQSPNTLTFKGNTTLNGIIVFENAGTTSSNSILMSGNFKVGSLPADPAYDAIRAIKGIAIMAPTAALYMTGSADSNFHGNVIVGTFRNGGSADLMFDQGSIIATDDTVDSAVFNGKTVRFTSTGQFNQPSIGVTYSDHFVVQGGSYLELH